MHNKGIKNFLFSNRKRLDSDTLTIDEVNVTKANFVWIRGWIASKKNISTSNVYEDDIQIAYVPRADVEQTLQNMNSIGFILRKRIISDSVFIKNLGGLINLEYSISDEDNLGCNSQKHNIHLKKAYDVAIINGPNLQEDQQVTRWRVLNRAEEIRCQGKTCKVYRIDQIENIDITSFEEFIVYRASLTPALENFLYEIKKAHKRVIFDLDDLDLDGKFIENIPSLLNERKNTMLNLLSECIWFRSALEACGEGSAPTKKLVDEMLKYVSKAQVVRNKASLELLKISEMAYKNNKFANTEFITIGYFSGNIQHNDDIAIVEQALTNILCANDKVRLLIVGIIDIPELLKKYADRVIFVPYQPWRELPDIMMECDIALAPICETEFNEAKSEIKWIETALLRIPLIATDFGAFKEVIANGNTGLLCKNTTFDWETAILKMINNAELRKNIGVAAYAKCCSTATTFHI